jgi:ParB-like chromosome segregation protein Spo0J
MKQEHTFWESDDARLPADDEIKRVPPDKTFINTLAEQGQLQAIGICHTPDDKWVLAFGRKRLLAIRSLKGEGKPAGKVLVRIFEGFSEGQANILGLVENAQRNGNEISDAIAVEGLLKMKLEKGQPAQTYQSIAKLIGKSKSYVKKLDEDYAKVPEWAKNATLDGKIAPSVIKKLGDMPVSVQKACKETFKKVGKLTLENMHEQRQVIRAEATAQVFSNDTMTSQRQFYSREDLNLIKTFLSAKEYNRALETIEGLLNQTE